MLEIPDLEIYKLMLNSVNCHHIQFQIRRVVKESNAHTFPCRLNLKKGNKNLFERVLLMDMDMLKQYSCLPQYANYIIFHIEQTTK